MGKKIFRSVDIISRQSCQHHNLQEIVDVLKQTLYLLIDPEYLEKKKKKNLTLLEGFFKMSLWWNI